MTEDLKLDVQLKPLVGKTVGNARTVRQAVWMIMVEGKHMGFVGFRPNSPISILTENLTPIERDRIFREVRKHNPDHGPMIFRPKIKVQQQPKEEDDDFAD